MREILFRAKRIDNGEWVEGYYCKWKQIRRNLGSVKEKVVDCIITWMSDGGMSRYEIDSETLCQYTGLKDKNGNRIWENSILKGFTYPLFRDGEFNYFATVEWSEEYKYFFLYTVKNPKSTVRGISEGKSELFEDFNSDDWEVIGNIFDDPELLKGE